MLSFLFRTLTAEPSQGAALLQAVTAETRLRHWYVDGGVPDTLDGRFAMLATLTALVLVRLEQTNGGGDAVAVALAERFVEVMESEHRELGLGDPGLGRTVRKLVGSLARRTKLWRSATAGERDWREAARESIYKTGVSPETLSHTAERLRGFWSSLQQRALGELAEGRLS